MPQTILIIEYEPRYTDRVRQALAGQPFTPVFARDGEEAMRALDTQTPALIILSSVIPKTTTTELIRTIRQREPLQQTPILLTVSGYSGSSPKDDARRFGASDILSKPYSETDLLGKVQQLLQVPPQPKLTSNEIFGDLLADEKPLATAPRKRSHATGDIDKMLADTLGGMISARKTPAPTTPRPKTQTGTKELDQLVEDTLSGLHRRKTPTPTAVPAERVPEETPEGIRFGNYLLVEKIATGGMAEVWKARKRGEEGFQKIVAIKKILPHLSDDQEFVEMFIDEAKLAAQLNHNNIIHIYDLGKIQNSYFIAMEYVDGQDLKSILKRAQDRGQPISVELALFIGSKIASALDYAHRKRDFDQREMGLVHRDVSPQNVLISHEGDIKLCDFGIAKAASKASHTQAGALKGKLQYMSPEQAWGKAIDRRSDIFALATVIFEMLTGRRLFTGDNEMSILEQVRDARVVPPSQINDEVSPEIDRVVLKALQKEPADRYQTAGEMARDLDSILYSFRPTPTSADLAIYMHRLWSEEPSAAPPPEYAETVVDAPAELRAAPTLVAHPTPPPAPAGVPMPAWDARSARKEKRSPVIPLTFVALIVAGIVGGYFYVRGRPTAPDVVEEQQPQAVAATPVSSPGEIGTVVPVDTTQFPTTTMIDLPATATTTMMSTTEPLLDPNLVALEVQRRLAAERERLEQEARLQQAATAAPPPPVRPVPQPVAPQPAVSRVTVAPPPEPQPEPAPATVEEPAPTAPAGRQIQQGDYVEPGTEGLQPARVTRYGSVVYPPMARAQRVEGRVLVNVLVDEDGQVLDVRVIRPISRAVGLNEAAEQIIRRSTFAPPTVNGVRVRAWTVVPVDFKL